MEYLRVRQEMMKSPQLCFPGGGWGVVDRLPAAAPDLVGCLKLKMLFDIWQDCNSLTESWFTDVNNSLL